MKKASIALLLMVIFAGILLVIWRARRPAGVKKVSLAHSSILNQYFYALDKKKLHLDGLEFDITVVQDPAALGVYVMGRAGIDLVEAGTPFAGVARISNPNVKIVGTLLKPRADDCAVVVKANSDIDSPQDLAGKRIGVDSLAEPHTILLKEVLKQNHNIPYESATYIVKPVPVLLDLLKRGDIDAVLVYGLLGYQPRGDKQNYEVVCSVFEEAKSILGDTPVVAVLVTNRKDLDKDTAKKALAAIKESFDYAFAHQEELSQELAGQFGISPEVYKNSFFGTLPTGVFLTREDQDNILKIFEVAQRQGIIDRQITEDIFFDQ